MRKVFLFAAGAAFLSACILGGKDENLDKRAASPSGLRVKPGFYRGDFGPDYVPYDLESELVLGSDRSYRYFFIQSGVALSAERGQWSGNLFSLLFSGRFFGYAEDVGVFTQFNPATDDTADIRAVNDSSFEKYEWNPDGDSLVWVPYRRAEPERPTPGKYVFRDTVLFSDSSFIPRRIETILEPNGRWAWEFVEKDTVVREVEAARWTVAGSFLVMEEPRLRVYDYALGGLGDWADTLTGGELAFRIHVVGDTVLQIWDEGFGYFTEYRKEP